MFSLKYRFQSFDKFSSVQTCVLALKLLSPDPKVQKLSKCKCVNFFTLNEASLNGSKRTSSDPRSDRRRTSLIWLSEQFTLDDLLFGKRGVHLTICMILCVTICKICNEVMQLVKDAAENTKFSLNAHFARQSSWLFKS